MQETPVWFLGWAVQSMGSQRVRHDWATFTLDLLATPKVVLIISYLVKSIFNDYILGYVSVTCYLWLIYSSWWHFLCLKSIPLPRVNDYIFAGLCFFFGNITIRRWWGIGRPGVLQSMESQTVGHDWATKQQQPVYLGILTELYNISQYIYKY